MNDNATTTPLSTDMVEMQREVRVRSCSPEVMLTGSPIRPDRACGVAGPQSGR